MRTSKVLTIAQLAVLGLMFTARPAFATFPGQNGRIVFTGNQSGSWQLYTINPDGTGLMQIKNLPTTTYDSWLPSFSPDGKQIAFCYGTGNSSSALTEIFVINSDGTNLKQLTNDGTFDCFPRWSPDGTHIVFAQNFVPTNQTLVTVMRSDGSGPRTTLTNGDFRFWGAFGTTYTPDGGHIVFNSTLGGFVSAVWIMNSDGSDPDRLTPAPLEGFAFDVSPDGKHLLLFNHQNTHLPISIYGMDINGKDIERLTHLDNVHDIPGSYSPDGKRIVFYSDRLNAEFTFDLFTMDADGGNIRPIATSVGACPDENCVVPSWGPKPLR
jgi:Tol biopolymer transport system component